MIGSPQLVLANLQECITLIIFKRIDCRAEDPKAKESNKLTQHDFYIHFRYKYEKRPSN